MLPSHRRAIGDIIACRTEALGADLWCCPKCGTLVSVFHSCKNRHCGQCNGARTQAWLEQRQAEILPIPYFHVTVTVPATLRTALRSHQTVGYGALIKIAAQSIIELARDPRWVGGTVGVLAVLHTWTQQLHLHPHVHCLVTGGGLSDAGRRWHPAEKNFLFPTKALGKLVRTRFRDAFSKLRLDISLPPHTWRTPWVVHITPWSEGKAVLDYFARYAFRIAITDRRIVRVDEAGVTFRYRDRAANCHRTATLRHPARRGCRQRYRHCRQFPHAQAATAVYPVRASLPRQTAACLPRQPPGTMTDLHAPYLIHLALTQARPRQSRRRTTLASSPSLAPPGNRNADRLPPRVSIHGRTTVHSTPCRPLFRSSPSPKRQSRA